MGAKKRTQFHEVVKSKEHFEEYASEDNKKVVIFDFHLDWCGPCTCMESNYATLFF